MLEREKSGLCPDSSVLQTLLQTLENKAEMIPKFEMAKQSNDMLLVLRICLLQLVQDPDLFHACLVPGNAFQR
jgi:hypothetical protein